MSTTRKRKDALLCDLGRYLPPLFSSWLSIVFFSFVTACRSGGTHANLPSDQYSWVTELADIETSGPVDRDEAASFEDQGSPSEPNEDQVHEEEREALDDSGIDSWPADGALSEPDEHDGDAPIPGKDTYDVAADADAPALEIPVGPACGNGVCEPSEGPFVCPEDCCGSCGDGKCVGYACGEDPISCPNDCDTPCGNHVCEKGESPQTCSEDCAWKVCGNGVCEPEDGGPSICPQDCGTACGNCVCEKSEDWLNCPIDCGYCGDGVCSSCGLLGENPTSCPSDCCVPDCKNKSCGPDGCGGLCGVGICNDSIPCTNDICDNGQCKFELAEGFCLIQQAPAPTCYSQGAPSLVNPCFICDPGKNATGWTPLPDGSECGTNMVCKKGTCGCAYEKCSSICCAKGQKCYAGKCCDPACNGKECGDDGCGGVCGLCGANEHCEGSTCVCDGVECNGQCCAPGESCNDGVCACAEPNFRCGDRCCSPDQICGPDGCISGIRVNGASGADIPGCGNSWTTACRTVEYALSLAGPGDAIFLAQGTYTPSEQTSGTFITMKEGMAIYGGFCGFETSLSERDLERCKTTVDGERKVYHVVKAASRTLLDGLTIKGGDSTVQSAKPGDASYEHGQQLYVRDSRNVLLVGCKFVHGNSSSLDIYLSNSSITAMKTVFTAILINARDFSQFTAYDSVFEPSTVSAWGQSSLTFQDCVFHGWMGSTGDTRAISAWEQASLVVKGCKFQDTAPISVWDSKKVEIEDSYFSCNVWDCGGLLFLGNVLEANVRRCSFLFAGMEIREGFTNIEECLFKATTGAIRVGESVPVVNITRCQFFENRGPAVTWNINSMGAGSITISNSLFAKNTLDYNYGSGVLNEGYWSSLNFKVNIINSTFVSNVVPSCDPNLDWSCAGAIAAKNAKFLIVNSIFWGNAPREFPRDLPYFMKVYYSDVAGSSQFPPGTLDPSVVDMDPQFVNPAAGDYHLRPTSPLIDSGTSLMEGLWAPIDDLDGNPRPCGSGYDIGAYEFCQ